MTDHGATIFLTLTGTLSLVCITLAGGGAIPPFMGVVGGGVLGVTLALAIPKTVVWLTEAEASHD